MNSSKAGAVAFLLLFLLMLAMVLIGALVGVLVNVWLNLPIYHPLGMCVMLLVVAIEAGLLIAWAEAD